jgi:hypothetical protein
MRLWLRYRRKVAVDLSGTIDSRGERRSGPRRFRVGGGAQDCRSWGSGPCGHQHGPSSQRNLVGSQNRGLLGISPPLSTKCSTAQ